MRLVANSACTLHLVHPLGFPLDDARLRRAGMDYREYADVVEHETFDALLASLPDAGIYAFSRDADRPYHQAAYRSGDVLLFGQESTGLPAGVVQHQRVTAPLRIPMKTGSRSLNMANSVAIVLYEALRQNGYPGLS